MWRITGHQMWARLHKLKSTPTLGLKCMAIQTFKICSQQGVNPCLHEQLKCYLWLTNFQQRTIWQFELLHHSISSSPIIDLNTSSPSSSPSLSSSPVSLLPSLYFHLFPLSSFLSSFSCLWGGALLVLFMLVFLVLLLPGLQIVIIIALSPLWATMGKRFQELVGLNKPADHPWIFFPVNLLGTERLWYVLLLSLRHELRFLMYPYSCTLPPLKLSIYSWFLPVILF